MLEGLETRLTLQPALVDHQCVLADPPASPSLLTTTTTSKAEWITVLPVATKIKVGFTLLTAANNILQC